MEFTCCLNVTLCFTNSHHVFVILQDADDEKAIKDAFDDFKLFNRER